MKILPSLLLPTITITSILGGVSAQNSLTLWNFGGALEDAENPVSGLPTPTLWVAPIGTGSDGGETTYLYDEVINFSPSGTQITSSQLTLAEMTIIASASGYKFSDSQGLQGGCTLLPSPSPSDSILGDCIYQALLYPSESLITVTETNIPLTAFAISISAPTSAISISTPTSAPTPSSTGSAESEGGSTVTTASSAEPSNSVSNGALGREPDLWIAGLFVVGLVCGSFM